jgi:hypothetical protein
MIRSSIGPSSKLCTLGVGEGGALGTDSFELPQRLKKPDFGVDAPLAVGEGTWVVTSLTGTERLMEDGFREGAREAGLSLSRPLGKTVLNNLRVNAD